MRCNTLYLNDDDTKQIKIFEADEGKILGGQEHSVTTVEEYHKEVENLLHILLKLQVWKVSTLSDTQKFNQV